MARSMRSSVMAVNPWRLGNFESSEPCITMLDAPCAA
jgi:hypothetical protein